MYRSRKDVIVRMEMGFDVACLNVRGVHLLQVVVLEEQVSVFPVVTQVVLNHEKYWQRKMC